MYRNCGNIEHPKAHTEKEIKWIKDLIRRNPHITLNEIWYKLKVNKGYTRKPVSLYRILRQIGYYNNLEIKGTRIDEASRERFLYWYEDQEHQITMER